MVSFLVIFFGQNVYDAINDKYFGEKYENDFLYGSKTGEHGKISVKLRLDSIGSIKEVYIVEHPDNDIASTALQKLINNSLDKVSADEVDTISGATETSDVYKSILRKLLDDQPENENKYDNVKLSMADPDVLANVERQVYNQEGFKSGIGGYIFNQFQDADYNRNGNLVTNEYICAVMLNQYNRIEDVKFDHITSNMSFDRYGKVPTGGAKAYTFLSDKSKVGFNGLANDGNYIDIFDFEDKVLTLRHFEDIKNSYINKKGYAPFIYALENAIDNARFIGAGNGDTLGLSAYKVLKKSDIKDSTDDENGSVNFVSTYGLITVDKDSRISSAMFDNVTNLVTLTNVGKILGSREKEVYTLNELTNPEKYSKIDSSKFELKAQLNVLGDFLRGNDIDTILGVISKATDDKGNATKDGILAMIDKVDFIEFTDIIAKAFINAVKIKA